MTDAERTKLTGIAAGANNYSHPVSHPASMVEESTTRKFMTNTEKTLLSTLGTNAALKDFSNVSTKNLSQNGYYKLPDGLMIQWGYASAVAGTQTIYLNTSFYDTNYTVVTNTITANASLQVAVVKTIRIKNRSSLVILSVQQGGAAGEPWNWLAIGRWK